MAQSVANNQSNLIEFYVRGKIYYAERGMTWEDFIPSDYNDGSIAYGKLAGKTYVRVVLGNIVQYLVSPSGSLVLITDEIIENFEYLE